MNLEEKIIDKLFFIFPKTNAKFIGIGDDWVLLRFMRFNKFNRGIDYIHHTPG